MKVIKASLFSVAIVFAILINVDLSQIDLNSDMSLVRMEVQSAQGEADFGKSTCYSTSNSGGETDTTRCNTCLDWDDRDNLRDQGKC